MNKQYVLRPIGHVETKNGGFSVIVDKEFTSALSGLQGFSHLQVLCWGHLFDEDEYRQVLETDKPYKKAPDKLGIFATRSPLRPNPVLVSVVPVIHLDMENGIIRVPYIDAEDETPVIDIKPYHPSSDRIREVNVPEWCRHWPQWYEDSATFSWQDEFLFES
jgi:tRNA (adenine37-N6)-methyltransferase